MRRICVWLVARSPDSDEFVVRVRSIMLRFMSGVVVRARTVGWSAQCGMCLSICYQVAFI